HVDAGVLGDPRAGMVVGGDHDDGLGRRLLLGQAPDGHPRAWCGVRAHFVSLRSLSASRDETPAGAASASGPAGAASVSRRSTTSSTWMMALARSTCTTTGS